MLVFKLFVGANLLNIFPIMNKGQTKSIEKLVANRELTIAINKKIERFKNVLILKVVLQSTESDTNLILNQQLKMLLQMQFEREILSCQFFCLSSRIHLRS